VAKSIYMGGNKGMWHEKKRGNFEGRGTVNRHPKKFAKKPKIRNNNKFGVAERPVTNLRGETHILTQKQDIQKAKVSKSEKALE